ncbi:MAG: hypothetical protein QOE37_1499 [Microbacteriaceae bacterium]|nr:hypothetical protein [Microbacteriaceae bacterium]
MLVVDLQRFAAGGEHRELGAGPSQHLHPIGDLVEDVLAVIEQQEHAPVAGEHAQGVVTRPGGCDRHPQRRGHRVADLTGIAGGGEVDEPHAVREGVSGDARRLHRQPCLAGAGRPGHGHQALAGDCVGEPAQVVAAPDQRLDHFLEAAPASATVAPTECSSVTTSQVAVVIEPWSRSLCGTAAERRARTCLLSGGQPEQDRA